MVMISRRAMAVLITLVLWPSHFAQAETRLSSERVALHQMSIAIELYPKLYNGRQVAGWEQVAEVFNLSAANKTLVGKPAHPLEDHYAFVADSVPFKPSNGSKIIMIRTVPLEEREGQPQWRYLIVQNRSGALTATRSSESAIQAMFQQAGVPLPAPKAGLPTVETEAMRNLDNQRADDPESREGADERRVAATPSPFASREIPGVPSASPITAEQTLSPPLKRSAWAWLLIVACCGVVWAALRVWKRRT